MLIKLRRQQAELNSLREHTVAQLMALGMEGPNAKVSTQCYAIAGVGLCMPAFVCFPPTVRPNPAFVRAPVRGVWWCAIVGLLQTKMF